MIDWWNSLSPILKFYWFLAIPSTALFLLQTVLTLIGIGDFGDSDHDFSHNVVHSHFHLDVPNTGHEDSNYTGSASFKLLTLRNIITFFTVFAWSGIVFTNRGLNFITVLSIAFAIALTLALILSGLYYFFSRMTEEGTMDLNKTLGAVGEVYLAIPAYREDTGKVMILVRGALREIEAVTDGERIATDEKVKVIGVVDNRFLLVEKINILE